MHDLDHPRGMILERGIGAIILVALIALTSLCYNRGRKPHAAVADTGTHADASTAPRTP